LVTLATVDFLGLPIFFSATELPLLRFPIQSIQLFKAEETLKL